MRHKDKKRLNPLKKNYKSIIFLVVLLLAFFSLIAVGYFNIKEPENQAGAATNAATDNTPPITPTTSTQMQDFPNTVQGTFTGILNAKYIKEELDPIIVLYVSSRLPGMAMIYYPQEKKLVCGTPQMVINDISLFDGAQHTLTYSFQNPGIQYFSYDNKILSQSDFHLNIPSLLTGNTVGVSEKFINPHFGSVEINSNPNT